jgi:tetratricopeptide (TPR) repeat protein
MKRTFSLILGIFCWLVMFADDMKTEQDSAMNYYLAADYENALRIYDSIYSLNYSSPELFYNLGNCYYNTGDIANAVYFYEKALALSPGNKDIKHNLKIANLSVKSKTDELPEVFYKRWHHELMSQFSSDTWAVLSVCLFILSLAATGLYFFSRRISLRKTGFISGIVFFILSFVLLFFAHNQGKQIIQSNFAVIFETSLVKSSPSEDSNNLFEISEGLKVEIADTLNGWSNIRLPDGKEGWVKSDYLKRI